MILLSTFHVFPGRLFFKSYREKHKPNPVNHYGMTKLGAEMVRTIYPKMKVVRTGYLFDRHRLYDSIKTLDMMPVGYPNFQYRSFTHVRHFCESLLNDYIPKFDQMPPVLHIGGSETVSWYEFMKRVSKELGTKHQPYARDVESRLGFYVRRAHRAGLDNSLSTSLDFGRYSLQDGIGLLK